MLPLDGITVISLEQAVAAPFATRQLADLGARVIKIERPGVGDFARDYDQSVKGQSAYFMWLNRSKESMTLDLKSPRANEILAKLISKADVFVQNLAPGATKRLGLASHFLHARYPRLVVCDISGYGDTGPYATKKAYDLLVQAEAGILSVTGTEEVPSKVGISVSDIGTGMHAFSAILAALYQREKTGKGTRIDLTMFESMVEWMQHPVYYTHFSGKAPKRSGPDHATIVPYGRFRTGDGKFVLFGIQNEREWVKFCDKVLMRADLGKNPLYDNNTKRTAARGEVVAFIEHAFAKLSAEDVMHRLDEADIANARLNDPEEVWNHPQLKARNRWSQVDTPVGRIPALLPPATFSDVTARMDPVPRLGEHTDVILMDLGFTVEDIESMREQNAI